MAQWTEQFPPRDKELSESLCNHMKLARVAHICNPNAPTWRWGWKQAYPLKPVGQIALRMRQLTRDCLQKRQKAKTDVKACL